MNFERLSGKAVIIWEIVAALLFGVLLALVLFIFIPGTWLWYTVLWLLGAIYVLTAFLYVPLYYLSVEYAVGEEAVIYRKGVIFPNTQILYRDRIAFVTVYNNPLTPLLKLSSLTISAAGGNIHIWFMNSARAQEIADELEGDGR